MPTAQFQIPMACKPEVSNFRLMLLISRHGRLRYDLQPLVSVFEQRCQHADTILLDSGPYLCSPASITNSQIFELSMSVPDSSSRASPTLRSLDATSCTNKTEKPCDIYAGAEYPKGLTLVLISMALCFSIIIGGLVSITGTFRSGNET